MDSAQPCTVQAVKGERMHIAITGNIGSGKSTVSELLRSFGYKVQDADTIAKQYLESDIIKTKLMKRYGQSVLGCDNRVDKRYLAAQIFNHPSERKLIESWIHPLVYESLRQGHTEDELVFSEVPLLFESHGETQFDQIWLVISDEDSMRQRTKAHRSYTDEEFDKRLRLQIPQTEKVARADVVIENTKDISTLKALVIEALEKVKSQYEI